MATADALARVSQYEPRRQGENFQVRFAFVPPVRTSLAEVSNHATPVDGVPGGRPPRHDGYSTGSRRQTDASAPLLRFRSACGWGSVRERGMAPSKLLVRVRSPSPASVWSSPRSCASAALSSRSTSATSASRNVGRHEPLRSGPWAVALGGQSHWRGAEQAIANFDELESLLGRFTMEVLETAEGRDEVFVEVRLHGGRARKRGRGRPAVLVRDASRGRPSAADSDFRQPRRSPRSRGAAGVGGVAGEIFVSAPGAVSGLVSQSVQRLCGPGIVLVSGHLPGIVLMRAGVLADVAVEPALQLRRGDLGRHWGDTSLGAQAIPRYG